MNYSFYNLFIGVSNKGYIFYIKKDCYSKGIEVIYGGGFIGQFYYCYMFIVGIGNYVGVIVGQSMGQVWKGDG